MVIKKQHEVGSDMIYTPNHVNNHTVSFDHIMHLYPVFNFARDKTLLGHLTTDDHSDKLYPFTLHESIFILFDGLIVMLTKSINAPYYAMAIFVALAYLIAYKILYKVTGDYIVSLCGPAIMIFGYHYLLLGNFSFEDFWNIAELMKRVHLQNNSLQFELNSFYRISALGSTYFIFLSYIFFLLRALDAGGKTFSKNTIVTAVLLGCNFYSYIYYIMTLGIMTGLMLLYYVALVKKDDNWTKVKILFVVLVLGAFLGSPLLYSVLDHMRVVLNSDFWLRMGIIQDKMLFPDTYRLLFFFCVIAFLVKKSEFKLVSLALILAIIIGENAHLVFGVNMQPYHIYTRAALPFVVLSMVYALFSAAQGRIGGKIYQCVSLPLIIAIAVFYVFEAVHFSQAYAANTFQVQGIRTEQKMLFEWFRKYARTNDVVGSLSPEIAIPLNLFVPVRIYIPFAAQHYLSVKNEEINEKLALLLFLNNAKHNDIYRYYSSKIGQQFEQMYLYYYFGYFYGPPGKYVSQSVEKALEELEAKLAIVSQNPRQFISKYRLDYLIKGSETEKENIFPTINAEYLHKVADFKGYSVYKLTPPVRN